ncbi:MAG: ABC transporter ATP-binding protein/permease, partial [Oscillospiraceae bacterium]|nr:ABC transporter ATP-binding protein/permease [Oscillospiraceae bacterium]
MGIFKKPQKEENTDEFHRDYGLFSNIGYILKAFARYKRSLFFLLIAGGIAGASMSYIWSFIGKLVIDMIERQAGSADRDITPLLWLVVGAVAIELVFLCVNNVSAQKLDVGFTYIRMMLVKERIAKTLSMEYETLETPEMLDRLQKAKRATNGSWQGVQGMMTYMQTMMTHVVSVAVSTVIMASFNPWIILVVGILSVIQFLFFDYIRRKDKREMWDAMMPHWRKLEYMENVTTDFSYAKDIRLFGMRDFLSKRQKKVYDKELEHWWRSRQYWVYNTLFSHGIAFVRNVIVVGWLIMSVVNDGLSIGNFTLYFSSSMAFSGAAMQVLTAISGLKERSAHTDDFRSYMDIPISDETAETIPIPEAEEYEFTFENVSFRYKGQENYALKNINITLTPGEKLAVVGLNGAGKTTFIKLLLRLYAVAAGRILLNGPDIR